MHLPWPRPTSESLGTGTDLAKAVADIVIATGKIRAAPLRVTAGPLDAHCDPSKPLLGIRVQHPGVFPWRPSYCSDSLVR